MNTTIDKPIKCVVWDLDNTIWDGILAEGDLLQVREGVPEALKALDSRGILNSIASRNGHEDAMKKLLHSSLQDYFIYPQIGWGSKSESIKTIKEKLNIGFDAIAFVDDQDFELAEVKSVYPEVACFKPEDLSSLLEHKRIVDSPITPESSSRRLMYQTDQAREDEEKNFSTNLEFLASLNLVLTLRKASRTDLARIQELTIRTNQLNATGYTYSEEDLANLLDSSIHEIWVVELQDRFGSYGKIGVVLLEKSDEAIIIKLLLISCRVISRGIGNTILTVVINQGIIENKKILAEFRHTSRNKLMYITYKFANFKEVKSLGDAGALLEYDGKRTIHVLPHYINVVNHP